MNAAASTRFVDLTRPSASIYHCLRSLGCYFISVTALLTGDLEFDRKAASSNLL